MQNAFLPKQDHTNKTNLHSSLSPLIECPCSDRMTRTLDEQFTILTQGKCGTPIATESDCEAASSVPFALPCNCALYVVTFRLQFSLSSHKNTHSMFKRFACNSVFPHKNTGEFTHDNILCA